MIRSTLTTTIALIASMLTAYGCGGGSSKPLSKTELIAKADSVCGPVVKTIAYETLTPEKIVRFAQRLADLEEHAYKQLSGLIPPASMMSSWQLIVDGYRESARDFRGLERLSHPSSETGSFEPLYGDIRKSALLAREEGFKECGEY